MQTLPKNTDNAYHTMNVDGTCNKLYINNEGIESNMTLTLIEGTWTEVSEAPKLDALLVAKTIRNQFTHLDVEICGDWAWIGNTTKEDAKPLKELGFGLKWSPNKAKWYFVGTKASSFGKKSNMDDIRAWHGSMKV